MKSTLILRQSKNVQIQMGCINWASYIYEAKEYKSRIMFMSTKLILHKKKITYIPLTFSLQKVQNLV